jgi:hypothetical protein
VIKFISTRIWLRFAVLLKSDLEVQQTGLETFSRLLLALLPFLKGEVKAMLPSAITQIYTNTYQFYFAIKLRLNSQHAQMAFL